MTSLAEYYQTVGFKDLLEPDENVLSSSDVVLTEKSLLSNAVGDTNTGTVNNFDSVFVSTVDGSEKNRNEEAEKNYDCNIIPERGVSIEAVEVVSDSIASQIGPFSDNRPICDCGLIKDLTSRTEARFLLSLLPDMAEMNEKQKKLFKQKMVQLISDVDSFDLIEDN